MELDTIREMKEKLSLVVMDYDAAASKAGSSSEYVRDYQLPDGRKIKLNISRFKCPELMFKPELDGKEMEGIHKLIFNSIMKCDLDIRSDLYTNVVLSGGTTMF